MDGVKELFPEIERILNTLQRVQEMYDDDMWEIESPAFSKMRHVLIHLCVTLGKLASTLESMDHRSHRGETSLDMEEIHGTVSPLVADLLIYCLQIANLINGNIGTMLRSRYKQNGSRFAPNSSFAEL